MSHVKVPPFDVLTAQAEPYSGFGDVLPPSPQRDRRLLEEAEGARSRVEEGFRQDLRLAETVPGQLDEIINEMWSEVWDPATGNVNLFITDFGLVLVQTMLSQYGGILTFRSESDVTHLSVRWPVEKVEAFPFHKLVKRLYQPEGDSIEGFVIGLSRILQSARRADSESGTESH